ncbi:Hpt domain-containing protein [bacterium]|nr:Hpt domain-containing protein [bacterium]
MNRIKISFSILIVLISINIFQAGSAKTAPLAKEGILKLSDWDFQSDGLVGLNGQWEFFWKQLLSPEDFLSGHNPDKTGYINAPGYWDGYQTNDETLNGQGYATFRLRITGLLPQGSFALDIPLMHTAYKLWVDGRLVSSNGEVGKTRNTSLPQYLPKTPVLENITGEMEIVLQISNFHHNNGGIWQTLYLGLQEKVISISQLRTAFDLFLLGAIFIMALYHFALYALRRKEYSPLFFGIFCLIISFRISLHGSTIFSVLFPNASWELLVKLDYFTLYFGLSYYIAFIRSLYPLEFSKKILNLIILISMGFVVFTILVPATIFTAYLSIYQMVMGLTCLFICYVIVRAIISKREGARVVLAGCLVLILTFVNDVLYNREIIHTADLVGVGLFIMIFSQSYVLSSRFSKAFKMVEVLSIHLEQIVKERTAAIKDLLDNTGQGFFSFSKDYKIQKYTSKATQDFFSHSIENEDVVLLLFPEKAEDLRKLLNLIFEDSENLDLVEDILPKEIKRDNRVFRVDYHWINPSETLSGRVMIVMTDITMQRELEQQLEKDEIRNQMILKIAVDRNGFVGFLDEINHCLSQVDTTLDKALIEINANELFRHFHTIKGGMASYFFSEVAAKAHEIENLLDCVRSGEKPLSEETVNTTKLETNRLREILNETLTSLDQIIPRQMIEAHNRNYFMVAESKLEELEKTLGEELTKDPSVKHSLRNIRKQPLRNNLKKFASDAQTLAAQLGKQVKITLIGEETEIIHKPYRSFFSSLIHLIRNSIDHGIEYPDVRLGLGKPSEGNLEIKVEADESNLSVSISDDGTGIEAATIKTKALEKGMINDQEAASMSEGELIKLIFKAGFSTNEEVTDLSGRGVGMDAVADEVAKLKGKIKIKTQVDKGTCFAITIPQV